MSWENYWFVYGDSGPPALEDFARRFEAELGDRTQVVGTPGGAGAGFDCLAFIRDDELIDAMFVKFAMVGTDADTDGSLEDALHNTGSTPEHPALWPHAARYNERLGRTRWACTISRGPRGRLVDAGELLVMRSYPEGIMYREAWFSAAFDWGNDTT